jgi:two-component system chemotaxis response regulator CheB
LTDSHVTDAPATELIVIGASAGGLQPLRAIMEALPADLNAAILVVLHIPSTGNSVLPRILARSGALEVVAAEEDVAIEPGRVIVARPDRHLLVIGGRACVDRGPRENGHRPAIDPLFRSAAAAYGAACCGVILSGTRDDGTAGMAEIKAHGGVALVQDPDEALYPGMPDSAIAGAAVDAVLPVAALAAELERLVAGRGQVERRDGDRGGGREEILTITCPECGGVLTERAAGGAPHFTCHVGHAYSPDNLVAAHAEGVERAMWTAARSLEDRATLLGRMAARAHRAGNSRSARRFDQAAQTATEQVHTIRAAITALDDAAVSMTGDAEDGAA